MIDLINTVFQEFDSSLLLLVHDLSIKFGDILTPLTKFLSLTCDLPLLMIGWLGFILFFVLKDKKCGMMMCGTVIIGAILVTIILKNIFYRARPYVDVELYKSWWQAFGLKTDWDTSFPSGHACASMGGVTAFFIWSKKKKVAWLAFLYPLIIGMSRIYLCVHYPSDVIFGYIVGIIAACLCIPCVKLIYYLMNKYPNNFFSRYCLSGTIKNKV